MEEAASLAHYKAVKNKLPNIAVKSDTLDKLKNVVAAVNEIVIHGTQFLKLYLLHHYDQNDGKLPMLNKLLIMNCFQVVRQITPNRNTKNAADFNKLKKVFDDHYKQTMIGDASCMNHLNLRQILDYSATDILTQYETNIKQNYISSVERFVNVLYNKKQTENALSKQEKSEFNNKLRQTKRLVLDRASSVIPSEIKPHFEKMIIQRNLKKDNVHYDLQCHPQDYLPCMIYMMKFIESKGQKLNSIFPTRTDIIPKNITLDTVSLITLFVTDVSHFVPTVRIKHDLKKNVNLYKQQAWKTIFRTDMSCFSRTGYEFNHMIETDGVSCSILLVRSDISAMRYKPRVAAAPREKYLDDLSPQKLEALQRKT